MSALSPVDLRRAVSTAGLLSSDQDGEALAAVRALVRILGKEGLDPASVLAAGLAAKPDEAPPAPRRAAPVPVKIQLPHQIMARMCLAFPELLTEWERDFVENMVDLRRPSEKQKDRLKLLSAKIERLRK